MSRHHARDSTAISRSVIEAKQHERAREESSAPLTVVAFALATIVLCYLASWIAMAAAS